MTWTRFGRLLAIVVAALAVTAAASAQTSAPRLAIDELESARQAFESIPKASLTGDAARRMADLARDFNDFYTTYLAQTRRGPAEQTDAILDMPGGSWRLKLGIVNSDLRAASGDFDQPVIDRLNDVRARLDRFYSAAIALEDLPTTAADPMPNAAPAVTPMPSSAALLDRMQTLIDGLLAKGSDPVNVDRATLVELQRAVSGLRMAAQSTVH